MHNGSVIGSCPVRPTTFKYRGKAHFIKIHINTFVRIKQEYYMINKKIGLYPFGNYYVSSPSLNKRENRYMISMRSRIDGRSTSTSYARYLYQVYHKVILNDDQFVDHIDADKTHDKIGNLQILSREENAIKAVTDLNLDNSNIYTLKCPNCDIIFQKSYRLLHGKRAAFCSRSCAGSFYHNKSKEFIEQKIKENIIKIDVKIKKHINFCHKIESIEDFSTVEISENINNILVKTSNRPKIKPTKEELELYKAAGLTNVEIAKKYMVSDYSVGKWLKKYGILIKK